MVDDYASLDVDQVMATPPHDSFESPHEKPRFARGAILSLAVAVGVSGVAVWAAARFHRRPPPPAPEMTGVVVTGSAIRVSPSAPQWHTLGLGKAEAAREYWTDPVAARITVDETRAARVGAALGGRVSKVFVELGQTVKAGAPLLTVASVDLAALEAERAKAKVQLDANRMVLDRVSAIVEARALPEKERLAAAQQVRQSELDFRVAQSKLGSLKVTLNSDNEFLVKSPRDGIVVEKNVLPGQQIDAGSNNNLLMVADLSNVWATAELFEADGSSVAVGAKARLTIASLPGATLEGEVYMVSSVVDPERHSVPVRVRLENSDGKLKPNTYARMQFLCQAAPDSVELDAAAVISDGARQYVYVQSADQTFVRRDVVVGPTRSGKSLVMSGLRPGETVVQRGAILLDNQIMLSR
jgi:cobalt-zinc-cadmium efflux system membrane fusion protein